MTQPTTALLLPIPTWGFSHAVAELEPLDRAPAFVLSPSRRARYCHRPRSGMSEFYLPTPTNWRRGTCMVCGADVKLRASSRGWWAAQDFGPELHAPVHMINPCRHHAWRHLTWIDHDRYLVGCRCQLEP